MHYYQRDLAFIHDRGYGLHGDRCAPGIGDLLAPVRDGLVLELGCGSGALTRHLLAAGLRVVATDASPDMLALARDALGPGADLRELTLPGDPLPRADAVVSVGHVLSYLPDAAAVEAALAAAAGALRPGGVLAVDILDLDYGRIRAGERPFAKAEEDWAIITEFSGPAPDRFVRDVTTFVPDGAGAWRRGHERHENVLVDTSRLPGLLAAHGVRASVGSAFGTAELPPGLRSVTGRKDLPRNGAGARPGHGASQPRRQPAPAPASPGASQPPVPAWPGASLAYSPATANTSAPDAPPIRTGLPGPISLTDLLTVPDRP